MISRGLTQAEAAEALGIAPESYGRLERGRSFPSIPTLVAIARFYGIHTDAILGLEPIDSNPPRSKLSPEALRLLHLVKDVDAPTLRRVNDAVKLMVQTGKRKKKTP